MSDQSIFFVLFVIMIFELLGINMIGKAISTCIKRSNDKKSDNDGVKKTVLSLLILLYSGAMMGAEVEGNSSPGYFDWINQSTNYFMLAVDLVLLGILVYMKGIFNSLVDPEKVLRAKAKSDKKPKTIVATLTDAIPLEEEYTIELDHEYDGIRELDNNLPPWWKYGFYITIFIAVIYLGHYHVLGTGDLQIEEYNKVVELAEIEKQNYLEKLALNVDERNVTYLTSASALDEGKKTFIKYCKVCHGEYGQGTVGPNLTDPYWLYGGSISNIFYTVKYGAKNGMKSWQEELNPVQMQKVSSYIMSLQGSNPDNPKEAQGELYVEEEIESSESDNENTEEELEQSAIEGDAENVKEE